MSASQHRSNGKLPATEALADFVLGGRVDDHTLRLATSAVLDTVAVTIAGSGEPGPSRLQKALEPVHGPLSSRLLWSAASFNRFDAALITGTASHVLDYDDVSMLSVCHPSAPVLSALLNLRSWDNLDGRELIEAFVIGTEVLIRLGQAMGFRHYALGFHATATLGTVAAAAACARLLRLSPIQTRHALAIAASMSSGLQVNFGSMVKSLHVGIAASNGLRAVQLAAAGIEGANEVLSGSGFIRAFSGDESSQWPDTLRLGAPFVLDEPGFEQKRYPCCYMLHRMIEATLRLKREHGVSLQDVAHAVVDMPFGGTKPLIHPRPKLGLNGLFSGPYAVLAAIADGKVDLSSFTDAAVLRDDIQQRLGDVEIVERSPTQPPESIGDAPVKVTLTLRAGKQLSRTITVSPGSMDDPLTPDQLKYKWIDCLRRAQPSVPESALGALFDQGRQLAEMPDAGHWVRAIGAACSSSHPPTYEPA